MGLRVKFATSLRKEVKNKMIKKLLTGAAAVVALGVEGAHAAIDVAPITAITTDATAVGTAAYAVLGTIIGIFIGMKLLRKGANKAT
jgi:hypothetical protein